MSRVARVVAPAVLLLSLAGCGGNTGTAPFGVLMAADDRDYAACVDGTCEVLVSGPVDIPLTGQGGLTRISVETVTEDGIGYATDGGSGNLPPGCVSTFFEYGGGSGCGSGEPSRPEPVDGVLALQVVDVRDGTALLRLVSGKVGPPPASLLPPMPPEIPILPTWHP